MSTDSQNPESIPQSPAWWNLPKVTDLRIRVTDFEAPRYQILRSEYSDVQETIELLASYEGEFQVDRALSPILYVGDTPVGECQLLENNQARFLAFEPEKLQRGAPIFIGWPGNPESLEDTGFQYEIDG